MSEIVSPCVRICKLDAQQLCLGCGRTLDEIARWREMSDAERTAIMKRLAENKPDRTETAYE